MILEAYFAYRPNWTMQGRKEGFGNRPLRGSVLVDIPEWDEDSVPARWSIPESGVILRQRGDKLYAAPQGIPTWTAPKDLLAQGWGPVETEGGIVRFVQDTSLAEAAFETHRFENCSRSYGPRIGPNHPLMIDSGDYKAKASAVEAIYRKCGIALVDEQLVARQPDLVIDLFEGRAVPMVYVRSPSTSTLTVGNPDVFPLSRFEEARARAEELGVTLPVVDLLAEPGLAPRR